MTNSDKRPSGRASKGEVGVVAEKGRIKVNLPRQYFAGKQERRGLGLADTAEGWAIANLIKEQLDRDLKLGKLDDGSGNFNEQRFYEVLCDYGVKANLRLVRSASEASGGQLPPKPELSILEVWDTYCEYKRQRLAETTYRLFFRGQCLSFLKDAIAAVGEDALAIRNWLLSNRNHDTTKKLLSALSHAYRLALKQKMLNHNPFEGLSDDIQEKTRVKIIDENVEISTDNDVLDHTKAYTWDEALIILDFVESHKFLSHYHRYLKFKFLTGCRPGEASGFWWNDIKWDKECIVIQRSYSEAIDIHKPTKNENLRMFPMPRSGELWELLKSLPEGKSNENVFKSKTGKQVSNAYFRRYWTGDIGKKIKGIIPSLIEQGKISKYLPPYNTRHTFINHQINDIGIAPHVVNAWCEHSDDVSKEHYRQLDLRIVPGYGEVKQVEKSEVELLREQLKQQQEMIDRLSKLVEDLNNK